MRLVSVRQVYASIMNVMYTLAYRYSWSTYALLLHLEPKALHTHFVLLYGRHAIVLGVR